jgi:hypothetical protein
VESSESGEFLDHWDQFVESRSLPYYRDDHRLMMRQVLNRYPPGKLADLTDRDLLECVNLEDGTTRGRLGRSFRFFLRHFEQFLESRARNGGPSP